MTPSPWGCSTTEIIEAHAPMEVDERKAEVGVEEPKQIFKRSFFASSHHEGKLQGRCKGRGAQRGTLQKSSTEPTDLAFGLRLCMGFAAGSIHHGQCRKL